MLKEEWLKERWLKGESFKNRYRLTGRLTTSSPFHLGNGDVTTRPGFINPKKEPVKVSAIAVDHQEKPYVPGSSIKGVLRSWLWSIFSFQGDSIWAAEQDHQKLVEMYPEQKDQIQWVREKAGLLDLVFGTPFSEGKIEVWDAVCITENLQTKYLEENQPPYWHPRRLTYVDQSVAIDPETGTALDKKLYHFEVTPPGVSFEMNITGQNLTRADLGFLLFGLEAFNSQIWPLTLGAMSNRGFGRFTFELQSVHYLDRGDIAKWCKAASANDHAGYFGLEQLDKEDRTSLVKTIKDEFRKSLGERP